MCCFPSLPPCTKLFRQLFLTWQNVVFLPLLFKCTATYFTHNVLSMCQCIILDTTTPPLSGIWIFTPPPPPPVSLDWSHGWLAWMAVSPEWKYCRARGRHHLRTMRTDIWFTKMAMCCKIDVRELFIFYKNFFFIFFIIVFFFFFSWVNRFLILLTIIVC